MIKIFATRDPSFGFGDVAIRVIDRENNSFLDPIGVQMKTCENGTYIPPAMTLIQHEAQMLMDQLWDCGLRPTEGSGSAGAMAAVQKHLEDMRTMAFHFADVPRSSVK